MTKLKNIRENKGITQRELSEITNISISVIQKYEIAARDINKASCGTVKKLADALNVKMEDLLEEEQ